MNEVTLTLPQRKVLAEMLKVNHWDDCLWKAAKQKYEESRNSLRLAFVREAGKEAKGLLDKLAATRTEKSNLDRDEENIIALLKKRGLSVDSDGDLIVRPSSSHYKPIEERLDEELGTIDEVVNLPFERARVKLWTVATADEAERILEPFLHFELKRAK